MESLKRPGGRRVLFPAEIELCETVGITEDEYWYFVDLTQAYNGKRPKEYDVLPYVINFEALGIIKLVEGTAVLTAFGQFVLGIALTVVSALLTPKPRAETPPSLATAGQTGPKRFAPQTGFNSVQDLATFGEIVPLIFTKQEIKKGKNYTKTSGGIRVNTRLLWSQMLSLGSGQQLKALFMIGLGTLHTDPDFDGYAIGDLLLKNYINQKLALYIRRGGNRPRESNRYSDAGTLPKQRDRNNSIMRDVMSVDWDMGEGKDGEGGATKEIVSGTRSPSTQVQFGAYAPMPNGMRYKVPYELVLIQKSLKDQSRHDALVKRSKIRKHFPRYASLFSIDNDKTDRTNKTVTEGQKIKYVIGDFDPEIEFEAGEPENRFDPEKGKSIFHPWGVDDVKSSVDASREESDDALQVGESYLAGTAIVVCVGKSEAIWTQGTTQSCTFEVEERGQVDIRSGDAGLKRAQPVYSLFTLQKAAIASISNSKVCDVTEIGLKSKVFKQISGFPNVNSHPGAVDWAEQDGDETDGVVKRYQDENGSISLGPMNKYLTRYSFFRLQARQAGVKNAKWKYIDKTTPFCVKGNSPQPQYNFIRINHHNSDKEFEFRFIPYPGNKIKRSFLDNKRKVRILNASQKSPLQNYQVKAPGQVYEIFYKGEDVNLRSGDVSNTEWYLGEIEKVKKGEVIKLLKTQKGVIPRTARWVAVDVRTSNMDAAFHGEGQLQKKTHGSGTRWIWDNYRTVGWIETASGSQFHDLNPDSPVGEFCIERDGFRYCNGAFITTRRGNNVTRNKRGHYFGITKYKWDDNAEVVPEEIDDYATTTNKKGTGLTVTLKIYRNVGNGKYKAARWEIKSGGEGYKDGDTISLPPTGSGVGRFPGINNINIATDFSNFVSEPWPAGKNLNPYDAISDYYQYDAERSSHQDGPEHQIVYVNEQSNLGKDNAVPYRFQQAGIANAALRLNSSKEWNNFSQFSVYIKNGIEIKRLINDKGQTVTDSNKGKHGVSTKGLGPTNNFAEIAHALLTDRKFGLSNSIGATSVDKEKMIIAAKFCEANGFYWDGVVTDKQNVREFIYKNAVFNLLDFAILGGKFALFPSVPFDPKTFKIPDKDQKEHKKLAPTAQALFTDGNTKNLKVSFLSPEERQNFIGTVYFRKEVANGFPEILSKTLAIATDNLDDDEEVEKFPIEVFDMSEFCTNEAHADYFLRYVLKVRQKIDHGIKFETTPQAAIGLKPGDTIRFISELTHNNRFENGVISADGLVQSVGNIPLNNAQIYYWKPGETKVSEATLKVTNNKAKDAKLYGAVFSVKQTTESNRLYKVESLAYSEEGLIEVGASHLPLLDDGTLATINYEETDFQSM